MGEDMSCAGSISVEAFADGQKGEKRGAEEETEKTEKKKIETHKDPYTGRRERELRKSKNARKQGIEKGEEKKKRKGCWFP